MRACYSLYRRPKSFYLLLETPPHSLITAGFDTYVFPVCSSGPNRGHYITIVKSHGFWLLFDDDIVEVRNIVLYLYSLSSALFFKL